jgi:hypothetical protein
MEVERFKHRHRPPSSSPPSPAAVHAVRTPASSNPRPKFRHHLPQSVSSSSPPRGERMAADRRAWVEGSDSDDHWRRCLGFKRALCGSKARASTPAAPFHSGGAPLHESPGQRREGRNSNPVQLLHSVLERRPDGGWVAPPRSRCDPYVIFFSSHLTANILSSGFASHLYMLEQSLISIYSLLGIQCALAGHKVGILLIAPFPDQTTCIWQSDVIFC